MLTVKQLNALKSKPKAYKVADFDGLFVYVSVSGTKSWRYQFRRGGKQQTKTYGKFPLLSLSDARNMHQAFRKEQALGHDGRKQVPTFAEFKREWYKHKIPTLKNIKHKQQVQSRVDRYCVDIDSYRLNEIDRKTLVDLVRKAADTGFLETAHRVAIHLNQLFDYAVDGGVIRNHFAANLGRSIPTAKNSNMACVKVSQAGKLLNDIDSIPFPVTRLALQFHTYTFARPAETRFMRWDQIIDDDFWLIPSQRLKGKKKDEVKADDDDDNSVHVVPLSKQAKQVLSELSEFTGESEWVFESPTIKGQPMSENMLLDALYGLGYKGKMTVHGFRALASTILNGADFNEDWIEKQLAHKEKNVIRAAYNRAEYLKQRIKMMQWYGDHLNKLMRG